MVKHQHIRYFFLATLLVAFAVTPALPAVAAPAYNTQTFLSSIDAGEGEVATQAYLDEPMGMDFAGTKAIYYADSANNVIEKINRKTLKVETVAGTRQHGYIDSATGLSRFAYPEDVAVKGKNGKQVFVADTGNNVIRKIENGSVSTFLTGLKSPKGVMLHGDTLFVSDTGNGRILAVNRNGGTPTVFAQGLNQPTKLLYWAKARSIIFVNSGESTVRAVNVDDGHISAPLIADLEDIGGIYRKGRSLYIAASTSIGVFNDIWKVRLAKPDPSRDAEAISQTHLSHFRETEQLNWPSDIEVSEDTLDWEEYYTWDTNLLYADNEDESDDSEDTTEMTSASAAFSAAASSTKKATAKKKKAKYLKFRKKGKKKWRKTWYFRIKPKKQWQTQQFIIKQEHQGDQPFFKVRLQYDNKNLSKKNREEKRGDNQSDWKKSPKITAETGDAPTNLDTPKRNPRSVTAAWDEVDGATKYHMQLFKKKSGKRLLSKKKIKKTSTKISKLYLKANQAYYFRVRAFDGTTWGDWSSEHHFRTPPGNIQQIKKIVPLRGTRIEKLKSGDYRVTLRFSLPANKKDYPRKNLRAQVKLASKKSNHASTVKVNRIYVLYKGGSSILAWRMNGTRPAHYAGKHRFQDDYGDKNDALIGRPKTVAMTDDGSTMYISQNNKITKYSFTKKKLTPLAGHLMDSYREGTGDEVRFSDVVDMVLSPDENWLYLVDRNNHRIRKLNTTTGTTEYITGAGVTNYAFESTESNGYQEGGPCEGETDSGVAGCAYFNRPTGIAIAPDGNTLYVSEGSNHRVRGVDVSSGQTWLIAGSGSAGYANGSGGAASFNGPYTLDVSADESSLYVADKYNHAIRKINLSNNAVTTLFGSGTIGYRDGSFSAAALAIPEYIREDNGVVYWTEAGTHTIRAASISGRYTWTLSGNTNKGYSNGAGSSAEWNNPKGFDFRGGKMYVADYSNDVIRTIAF